MQRRLLYGAIGAILMVTTLALVATWALGVLPVVFLPPAYMAEPIEGRVVDATTGQPIAGAVVAANWEMIWGWGHGTPWQLEVREAVADSEGRYRIDGWGPKLRWPPIARLRDNTPTLWAIAPGYELQLKFDGAPDPADLDDPTTRTYDHGGMRRHSLWNGRAVRLLPIRESGNYGHRLDEQAGIGILTTFFGHGCDWLQAPRFVRAVHAELVRLGQPPRYAGHQPAQETWRAYAKGNGCAVDKLEELLR